MRGIPNRICFYITTITRPMECILCIFVGYILSEDPTYITNYNNARSLIRRLDRDELLQELVKKYLAG